MRAVIMILVCLVTSVCVAIPAGVTTADNDQAQVEKAMLATNTAYVSIDALVTEVKAANNAAKLQAVLLKMLGRMDAEAGAKKAAKEKVKTDKAAKEKSK